MPRQPKPQPRPCIGKDCKRDTRSQSQVCRTCQQQGREGGPEVSARCLSCGTSTGREDRLCSGCAYHYDRAREYVPTPEDELPDGEWVLDGYVVRYIVRGAA